MEKRYRPNVAAVILAPSYPFDCRIFIAQRCDLKGIWQFPQGGIDGGESPLQALKRELKEEIGTNEFELLCEYPHWLSYDFPESVSAKKFYDFDGQIQKYFLVRLKPSATIDIKTKKPEFDEYKFVQAKDVLSNTNHFKKPIYSKVIGYFKEKGYI
ncbi:MAG: RNA pyrophosphohydrolase [Campylobacter sp.]